MNKQNKFKLVLLIGALVLAGGGLAIGQNLAPVKQADQTEQAQMQTATFDIQNMTCATCPITVRKAMQKVDGVSSVEVDFEAKTAKVLFDPSRASIDDIAAASTNAGYPASIGG